MKKNVFYQRNIIVQVLAISHDFKCLSKKYHCTVQVLSINYNF